MLKVKEIVTEIKAQRNFFSVGKALSINLLAKNKGIQSEIVCEKSIEMVAK